MNRALFFSISLAIFIQIGSAQDIIPLDTSHWEIQAQGHVFENYKGEDAIYINKGLAILKDVAFLNGTIEFDILLQERRSFPGIRFRAFDDNNMEQFYFRPHQNNNPDANQATPIVNGLAGWQLYFGPAYSVAYDYPFDRWMHVKLVVKNQQAQIYLDNATRPTLSWVLKHPAKAGRVAIGGGQAPMHFANVRIDPDADQIVDFKPNITPLIDGIVKSWEVSDVFGEEKLLDLNQIPQLIRSRKWLGQVEIEENSAANLSHLAKRPTPSANTVFAKVTIQSTKDQMKLFEFGYSDRVTVILNGEAIYKGNNQFRSRDYRYLGTIGLFDAVYLPLKRGENVLLLAVSESFGGWGVMGKFADYENISLEGL